MNYLEYIKLVIADAEAFWHIEDLDSDLNELKVLCNKRISEVLGVISGTEEYQREYIFESVDNWKGCIKYLESLEKFWIGGKNYT